MAIKIFVSWSGDRSYQLAEKLHEWLPTIVPNAKVFFSPDLGGGTMWLAKLLKELKSANYGIVCVSRQNQNSPWLHFEVGALWQRAGREIPVCPLLLDLSAGDLKAPLAYFQAREFTEAGLRSLCAEIAKKAKMDDAQFRRNFSVVWSQIASALRKKRKRKANRRLSKALDSIPTIIGNSVHMTSERQ